MLPETARSVTAILIGVSVTIASLEWLAVRELFAADGLLSWDVLRQRPRVLAFGPLSHVFEPPAWTVVLVLRAVCGLALLLPATPGHTAAVLAIALTSSICIGYRNLVGGDGSDQMTVVVLAGLLIASLPIAPSITVAGFVLIAGQAILSYVVAGAAKAASAEWRDGTALDLVLRTATYGSPRIAGWLRRHGTLRLAMCWLTIVLELSVALILVVPRPVFVAMLAAGLAFHVGVSGLMGLNVFSWSFAATYPALMVCHQLLHRY